MPAARSPARAPMRQTVIETATNWFDVPPGVIAEGMTGQWVRESVLGKEDTDHLIDSARNGWTPVPSSRLVNTYDGGAQSRIAAMLGDGVSAKLSEGHIRKRGLILCERPAEVTEDARERDAIKATKRLRDQLERVHGDAKAVSPELTGVRRGMPEPIPD